MGTGSTTRQATPELIAKLQAAKQRARDRQQYGRHPAPADSFLPPAVSTGVAAHIPPPPVKTSSKLGPVFPENFERFDRELDNLFNERWLNHSLYDYFKEEPHQMVVSPSDRYSYILDANGKDIYCLDHQNTSSTLLTFAPGTHPTCIKRIAIYSGSYVMALDGEGQVYTQGGNEFHSLHHSNPSLTLSPIQLLPPDIGPIVAIDGGHRYIIIATKDTLYHCGIPIPGVSFPISHPHFTKSLKMPKECGDIVSIESTCGYLNILDEYGVVYSAGNNLMGQLARTGDPFVFKAVKTPAGCGPIVKIKVSTYNTVALDKYGRAYSSGSRAENNSIGRALSPSDFEYIKHIKKQFHDSHFQENEKNYHYYHSGFGLIPLPKGTSHFVAIAATGTFISLVDNKNRLYISKDTSLELIKLPEGCGRLMDMSAGRQRLTVVDDKGYLYSYNSLFFYFLMKLVPNFKLETPASTFLSLTPENNRRHCQHNNKQPLAGKRGRFICPDCDQEIEKSDKGCIIC
jgi:alpha-tubulin suppressor-like RCC1 family protein